jgi:hypothetical protein
MKYRLSSIAAVAFAAVLSALVMTVHPVQAQTCADVEVHNIRPEQGLLMIAAMPTRPASAARHRSRRCRCARTRRRR